MGGLGALRRTSWKGFGFGLRLVVVLSGRPQQSPQGLLLILQTSCSFLNWGEVAWLCLVCVLGGVSKTKNKNKSVTMQLQHWYYFSVNISFRSFADYVIRLIYRKANANLLLYFANYDWRVKCSVLQEGQYACYYTFSFYMNWYYSIVRWLRILMN